MLILLLFFSEKKYTLTTHHLVCKGILVQLELLQESSEGTYLGPDPFTESSSKYSCPVLMCETSAINKSKPVLSTLTKLLKEENSGQKVSIQRNSLIQKSVDSDGRSLPHLLCICN